MGKPQRITKVMVPGDGTVINRKNTVVGASVIGDYVDANGFRVLVFERPEPPQATKPKPQAKPRARRTKAQIEADAREAEHLREMQMEGQRG